MKKKQKGKKKPWWCGTGPECCSEDNRHQHRDLGICCEPQARPKDDEPGWGCTCAVVPSGGKWRCSCQNWTGRWRLGNNNLQDTSHCVTRWHFWSRQRFLTACQGMEKSSSHLVLNVWDKRIHTRRHTYVYIDIDFWLQVCHKFILMNRIRWLDFKPPTTQFGLFAHKTCCHCNFLFSTVFFVFFVFLWGKISIHHVWTR